MISSGAHRCTCTREQRRTRGRGGKTVGQFTVWRGTNSVASQPPGAAHLCKPERQRPKEQTRKEVGETRRTLDHDVDGVWDTTRNESARETLKRKKERLNWGC